MDDFVSRLRNEKLIAVDTEFHRETTYYPKLALVQIATESVVACIDPLAFNAKPALQKILLDENITKIFHSCSQDMEVLYYYLDSSPVTIYDTQIACALLSEHQQISYAALVENELDIQLDKSQTRTNWLQRPLTEKQIQYAGDDVIYLYQLHQILDEKLHNKRRLSWFEEECENLLNDENSFQVASDQLWKRVKGASKLNRSKLAIVQSIAEWREQLAQQKDKIRRKIFADDIIIQLALNPPEDLSKLDQYIGRNHLIDNHEKQPLFDAIQTALQSPADEWPDNRFNTLDNQQKQLLKTLQLMVNKKADELGISSSTLYPRKALEKLILACDEPGLLYLSNTNNTQNWRHQCIGQQLIETIKNAL
jgi:ribonuclease D